MKIERVLDFETEGPQPLRLERFYMSDTGYVAGDLGWTSMGTGWRTSFTSRAFFVNGGSNPAKIHIALPDGSAYNFNKSGSTITQQFFNWTTKAWTNGAQGPTAKLVMNTVALRHELTTSDDRVWSYDYDGHLRSISAPGGYIQTLEYDTNGLNTYVEDNLGRRIDFSYNANGLLVSAQVLNGPEFRYTYLGRYRSDVDPDPAVIVQVPAASWTLEYAIEPDATPLDPDDNPRVRYHYENVDFPFALTGITDEKGVRYATWTYDAQGRVTLSQHADATDSNVLAYDGVANTVTVTNPLSKDAVYHFEKDPKGLNRLVRIEGEASSHCVASDSYLAYDANNFISDVTDEEGRVTHYVRNSRGLPTSITRAYGTPSALTTSITWNANRSLPTQRVEPGRTIDFVYDLAGNLTSRTETDTTSQTVPYSTNGQTRIWAYTYSGEGLLLTANGPLAGSGDTTTYTYDANGFLASVTDPVGIVTEVTAVTDRGQPATIEDPNGVQTTMGYDPMGRLTVVTQNPGPAEAVTSIEYDAVGQVTRLTRPDGSFLLFSYDDARRLVLVENNDGETIAYAHDAMGNVTSSTVENVYDDVVFQLDQTFDELGRLLQKIRAGDHSWDFGWDKSSLLTTITDPRGNAATNGYDALARLISESNHGGATVTYTRDARDEIVTSTDPRSIVTSYVRNGFGDVIQESSPDIGTVVYERDARGLASKITDARGVETQLAYDLAGRLLTRTYPSATAENIGFTYDSIAGGNKGKGRLTGATDQSGSTTLVYDALGHVTSETRVIGGQSYVVAYAYDPAGNVTQMTYPSGRIVTYARDVQGRIEGITTKKDAASPSVVVAYNVLYMPYGPLQSLRYGNELSLWRTFTTDYDLDLLLVEDIGNTTYVRRYHGLLDGVNLTNIWDEVDPARNLVLWYDNAGQIIEAGGPWGELTYYSDAAGNRAYETLVQGGVTTEQITWYSGTSNRAGDVTQNGTTIRTFTHDAAGNITGDDRAGTAYAYTHNARGRLSNLTVGGAQRGAYVYNAFDQLAIRTVTGVSPSGTTHTVQDRRGNIIVEATSLGATAREYIWLDDMPIAVVADVNTVAPKLWYVHNDHLDRPIMMTDGTKTKVWEAVWRPYGEAYTLTGAASLDLRFPGQWFQAESGLHYNWHRQYDPKLGRYLEPDPLGMPDGPNRWWYAGNSPLMNVDPRGLIVLPNDPSGLPPDWVRDPLHDPTGNTSRWRNPAGGCLEFNPGKPGHPSKTQSRNHWHDCRGEDDRQRDRHWFPGEDCAQPGDEQPDNPVVEPSPFSLPPVPFIPRLGPRPGMMPSGGGGGGLIPNL